MKILCIRFRTGFPFPKFNALHYLNLRMKSKKARFGMSFQTNPWASYEDLIPNRCPQILRIIHQVLKELVYHFRPEFCGHIRSYEDLRKCLLHWHLTPRLSNPDNHVWSRQNSTNYAQRWFSVSQAAQTNVSFVYKINYWYWIKKLIQEEPTIIYL